MPQFVLISLIFILSGFTMSFAGFGFALLAVPLLSLFLPVRDAVALQFPYVFGMFVYQAWHYRDHFSWQALKPMLAGEMAGITLGAYLLYHLPGSVLKKALAVFILLVVLYSLSPGGPRIRELLGPSRWWARFCGFLSGAFLGAYTIGGPPAVLYIFSVEDNPLKAKSFLASFFSIVFPVLAVVYIFTGLLTWQRLGYSLMYSPLVALSAVAGFWAFRHASNRLYLRVVNLLLVLTAMVLWWMS